VKGIRAAVANLLLGQHSTAGKLFFLAGMVGRKIRVMVFRQQTSLLLASMVKDASI
jgi:hypothetical protein